MAAKLGIIAGGGDLPRMIVDSCLRQGRSFHVFALEDQADAGAFDDVPHVWLRFGAAGRALSIARELGIRDVVMAGRVERPSLRSLRPDRRTLRFLVRLGGKGIGDDGMLRRIIREIEAEGFTVVGPDSLLNGLKPEAGVLGAHGLDEAARADIERGLDVLSSLSAADAGQAVVVQQGLILGIEAIEGTDAMLERCAALSREGPGGVLVKARKRGQEARADLPTIGPMTVANARRAGLRGIAVEAGGALILDSDKVVEMADEAGIFLIAVAAA